MFYRQQLSINQLEMPWMHLSDQNDKGFKLWAELFILRFSICFVNLYFFQFVWNGPSRLKQNQSLCNRNVCTQLRGISARRENKPLHKEGILQVSPRRVVWGVAGGAYEKGPGSVWGMHCSQKKILIHSLYSYLKVRVTVKALMILWCCSDPISEHKEYLVSSLIALGSFCTAHPTPGPPLMLLSAEAIYSTLSQTYGWKMETIPLLQLLPPSCL